VRKVKQGGVGGENECRVQRKAHRQAAGKYKRGECPNVEEREKLSLQERANGQARNACMQEGARRRPDGGTKMMRTESC
jgi:hypothetical protein